MIECVGFVEAVREFPVEVDGSLVARDGSLVLAGKGSLAGQSYETYNASGFATMYNHTLADFASFFGDLEIISPGLGDARQIRPGWRELSTAARRPDRILAGIARVPYRAR